MPNMIDMIRERMREKSTEELRRIYDEHNKAEWSDDAFEAVRQILVERGAINETPRDKAGEARAGDPDSPPVVSSYRPATQALFAGPLTQRVSVVDLDIPFWRMVRLMVKSAFAAIPAVFILCAAIFIVFMVIGILFGGVAALLQLIQPHR
jgi:hypothetical protein